ncbi:DUF3311 domain-containing protein [Caldiplasma sukawensis]
MNSILKFILLALPYIFMVVGYPIYDRNSPTLGGFPFFYWYQLVWIFVAAALTFSVYMIERSEYNKKGAGQ